MSSTFKNFKALHEANELLLLPNAWDSRSAIIFQEKKFPAVATSSAAVANSIGYEDGEGMPFSDYLFVIDRILASVKIPLTVDMEMGYGKTKEAIYENLSKLADRGVAGINIEDSVIDASGRSLQDATAFAKTIEFLKAKLQATKSDLFINVRCDTYILNVENKRKETSRRLAIYNTTGADGIFLPCITQEEDITDAIAHTRLPLNVMVIPGLPDMNILNNLGVKRVSMGPFMFRKVYEQVGELSKAVIGNRNFLPILPSDS